MWKKSLTICRVGVAGFGLLRSHQGVAERMMYVNHDKVEVALLGWAGVAGRREVHHDEGLDSLDCVSEWPTFPSYRMEMPAKLFTSFVVDYMYSSCVYGYISLRFSFLHVVSRVHQSSVLRKGAVTRRRRHVPHHRPILILVFHPGTL